jgi:hypothetical protein
MAMTNTFSDCYAFLEAIFLECSRKLTLERFEFGDNPAAVSLTIKEGFGRLMMLELSLAIFQCLKNKRQFQIFG